MNVKEMYDYQFLSSFKKYIPTKIPCQTFSVFEFEYTSFNQRKEIFVKEDYQFLSPFLSGQVLQCQKVSAFEIEYTFFIQRKEMNVKEM